MEIQTTTLICPRNDEESLQILKIAEKIALPTLVSSQAHGARLEKEGDLLARIMELNPNTKKVAIVEIPGPKEEQILVEQGLEVIIIDHHRYDDLDRMQEKSSIEQFRDLFALDSEKLESLGFDAKMIDGVGAIDRGFIWELKNEDLNEEERKRAIDYYRSLTLELGGDRRAREEELAQLVWKKKEMRAGILILRSSEDTVSVRDALSFIVAEHYPEKPPQTIIVQGKRRVYVQESEHAKELYDRYGGFTFGRDACWGKMTDSEELPSVEDILEIISSKH